MCQPNILRICLSSVRPVLEYAVQVWQDSPAYLSEAIERVHKRALNTIYPEAESYAHALQLGKLDRLDDRIVHLCYKYRAKMKSPSHPLHHLLPSPLLDAPNYPLRQKTQKYYLFGIFRSAGQREWRTFLHLNILSDSIDILIDIIVNYYTLDNTCLKIVKCTR